MAKIIKELKENGYDPRLKEEAKKHAREFTFDNLAKRVLEACKKISEERIKH